MSNLQPSFPNTTASPPSMQLPLPAQPACIASSFKAVLIPDVRSNQHKLWGKTTLREKLACIRGKTDCTCRVFSSVVVVWSYVKKKLAILSQPEEDVSNLPLLSELQLGICFLFLGFSSVTVRVQPGLPINPRGETTSEATRERLQHTRLHCTAHSSEPKPSSYQ